MSSASAAGITNLLLIPLDVVKIRMQKMSMESINKKTKVSFFGSVVKITREEGVRTFFNGL